MTDAASSHFHRGYTDRATVEGGKAGDPIRFLASTPGVKRDGLDLRANGWRLDNYRKSPVFQWVHDKTKPPIGRVDAEVRNVLEADVYFDQQDDFARQVESKYRRGFLHAVSVGWDFVDGQGTRLNTSRLSLDEIRDRAFYDMTELSGVPVPADPDALKASQRAGLRSLSRELAVLFDEQEDPDGEALADQVRAAVWDELERLGIEIPGYNTEPAHEAGFLMPTYPGPAPAAVDGKAARSLLAAFDLQGVK
jgi:hypothetical protein